MADVDYYFFRIAISEKFNEKLDDLMYVYTLKEVEQMHLQLDCVQDAEFLWSPPPPKIKTPKG